MLKLIPMGIWCRPSRIIKQSCQIDKEGSLQKFALSGGGGPSWKRRDESPKKLKSFFCSMLFQVSFPLAT